MSSLPSYNINRKHVATSGSGNFRGLGTTDPLLEPLYYSTKSFPQIIIVYFFLGIATPFNIVFVKNIIYDSVGIDHITLFAGYNIIN